MLKLYIAFVILNNLHYTVIILHTTLVLITYHSLYNLDGNPISNLLIEVQSYIIKTTYIISFSKKLHFRYY